jgi:formimidoylglutamate deiminase
MISSATVWLPDLILLKDKFVENTGLVSVDGEIKDITSSTSGYKNVQRLKGKALLPGLVNSHSHAFQRVIRGQTERRRGDRDTFWTWREAMYRAALSLLPEDIYDASRMAFLEMALSGITSVGEFHYLHRSSDGKSYDDPNLLASQVIKAAQDVGIRICLLSVAYARAGYNLSDESRQIRFIEKDKDRFFEQFELLRSVYAREPQVSFGIAPHSIRAVPEDYLSTLSEFCKRESLPFHMHLAEQPKDVESCREEHGLSPVRYLNSLGILSPLFTGVHTIHVDAEEIELLSKAGAIVCACPTTERDLGDGIVPADLLLDRNVEISLGTDSQVQIDLMEDARELEYHLRLQRLERSILPSTRLFNSATISGAGSLGLNTGIFEKGRRADFFTISLDDRSIAGSTVESLLDTVLFSLSNTAIRDVAVDGRLIVKDCNHVSGDEITKRFVSLQKRLW